MRSAKKSGHIRTDHVQDRKIREKERKEDGKRLAFSEIQRNIPMVFGVLVLVVIMFAVNTRGLFLPQNVNNLVGSPECVCIYPCNRYAVLYSDWWYIDLSVGSVVCFVRQLAVRWMFSTV